MKKYAKYIYPLLILVSVFVVYGHTLNHSYAGDDVIVILQNDRVLGGLNDIPSFFENIKSEQTQHHYGYRPISLLTFALDIQLFGQNPFWGHFSNLLYYSIACLLAFYFLTLIFSNAPPVALLIITLLFSLHPLHTEVVANIKSRDEILALIFGLLYLMQIWKWNQGIGRVILAILFAVLGFLSRENMAGFVLFGALLPFFQDTAKREKVRKMLISIVTFFMLILTYVGAQYFLQDNSVELIKKGVYLEDRFVANPLIGSSIFNRVLNALLIIQIALKLFFVPHPLVHDYGFHSVELINGIGDWRVYSGVAIFILIGYFIYRFRKKQPEVSFGLSFFVITFAIYLHVPIAGPDFFGERFLFAPILGLFITCIPVLNATSKKSIFIVPIGILIFYSSLTYSRSIVWKNNESLYEADKEQLADCARFQYNYANFLHLKYYDSSENIQKTLQPEILSHYEKTVEITDRILISYLDLGSAYMEFGYPEKAEPIFVIATEKYPNLSPPFALLGKFYLSQNDLTQARENFQKAIQNGPNQAEYYYLKTICEIKLGWFDEALKTIGKADSLKSTSFDFVGLRNMIENQSR